MNLVLTEDGVLKLGYYGLTTQAECYSIKKTDCEGIRSFAPEAFEGAYEMASDVWSFGIVLIEMMGITPFSGCATYELSEGMENGYLPFDQYDVKSYVLVDFLKKCFESELKERWNVNELMNVSVMG